MMAKLHVHVATTDRDISLVINKAFHVMYDIQRYTHFIQCISCGIVFQSFLKD